MVNGTLKKKMENLVNITIDNQKISVSEGTTILEAAKKAAKEAAKEAANAETTEVEVITEKSSEEE